MIYKVCFTKNMFEYKVQIEFILWIIKDYFQTQILFCIMQNSPFWPNLSPRPLSYPSPLSKLRSSIKSPRPPLLPLSYSHSDTLPTAKFARWSLRTQTPYFIDFDATRWPRRSFLATQDSSHSGASPHGFILAKHVADRHVHPRPKNTPAWSTPASSLRRSRTQSTWWTMPLDSPCPTAPRPCLRYLRGAPEWHWRPLLAPRLAKTLAASEPSLLFLC
jgi:hypothetical protein